MPRGRDYHVFLVCPHCFRSKSVLASDIQKGLDQVIHSLWRVQTRGAARPVRLRSQPELRRKASAGLRSR